jgi:hypothetical protein
MFFKIFSYWEIIPNIRKFKMGLGLIQMPEIPFCFFDDLG